MKRYWILVPLLLAIAVRSPLIAPVFVYDDIPLIAEHAHLGEPSFVREVFRRDYGLEFCGRAAGYYRPLLMAINVGLYQIAGPNPRVYHTFSLIVFCITLLVLMAMVRVCFPDYGNGFALVVACLYAVHPARIETVGMFASLPDQLIELLALSMVLLLAVVDRRGSAAGQAARITAYGFAALIGLAAGLTKESAFFVFTAMALTAMLYGWRSGRSIAGICGLATGLGLGVAAAMRLGAHIIEQSAILDCTRALVSGKSGVAVAGLLRSLLDLYLPRPVMFRYLIEPRAGAMWIVPLLLFGVLLLLLWGRRLRRDRLVGALLLAWFGASMLNLCLIVASQVAYSERYLPVIPAVLSLCFVAAVISQLMVASRSKLPLTLAAIFTAGFAGFAAHGALAFRSEEAFFSYLSTYAAPHDPAPQVSLAMTAGKRGQLEVMKRHIQIAASQAPLHTDVRAVKTRFARYLLDAGQPGNALTNLDAFIAEFPDHADNLALKAVALAQLGQFEDAQIWIGNAVEMAPTNAVFRVLLEQIERNAKAAAP